MSLFIPNRWSLLHFQVDSVSLCVFGKQKFLREDDPGSNEDRHYLLKRPSTIRFRNRDATNSLDKEALELPPDLLWRTLRMHLDPLRTWFHPNRWV
jgi:hypothetical protein